MLNLDTYDTHELPLVNSSEKVLVDADVYQWAKDKVWRLKDGYAVEKDSLDGYPHLLHRTILGLTLHDLEMVDHINRHKLDNRRSNLRTATRSENMMNRNKFVSQRLSSTYKGVRYLKSQEYWQARIQRDRKPELVGHFYSEEAAAYAYNQRAKELHGEFAVLNEIPYMTPEQCEEYRVTRRKQS